MIGLRTDILDASTIDATIGNCDYFRRLGTLIKHGLHPFRGSGDHHPVAPAAGPSESAEAAIENGLLLQQAGGPVR
jgi:hypothetical protein